MGTWHLAPSILTTGVGARGAPRDLSWGNTGFDSRTPRPTEQSALPVSASGSRAVAILPAAHPFRKHSENLRAIRGGLTQAERAHKAAIRQGNAAATEFLGRIHQLMIGLLAEAELRKIISDPDGFNSKEQNLLGQERSQLDRWLRTVEFAIRRHYSVPLHLEITDINTTNGMTAQYLTITNLLKDDLAPIIEDRNKLAHSQWQWLLNSKETAFIGAAPPPLNYLASRRRGEIIIRIADLIHALTVSEPTFQRDYARTYTEITQLQANINGADYPDFVNELRKRRRQSVSP